MKKEHSLKNKILFNDVINKGKNIRSKHLFISSQASSEKTRIGISVPKKTGNAVFRNKNKRRIKNIIQQENLQNIVKNKNIVIIVKKTFTDLQFEEATNVLIKELKKIN